MSSSLSRVLASLTCGCLFFVTSAASAKSPDEQVAKQVSDSVCRNVILVSLDGFRPEEMFSGADERLMIPELGVKELDKYKRKYGHDDAVQRRRLLMPHLWRQIDQGGWIAGDPLQESHVRVTNGLNFSYPGYNEMLTGFADPKVDSNAKKYNENVTVLEWLNKQPELAGKVAAFSSWDVFPFIINDQRSGIPVNAGWSPLTIGEPARLAGLNYAAEYTIHEWGGVRYDAYTAAGAMQAMRATQPRVLYVSLGETDDWAHSGRYDHYLDSVQLDDSFIQQIWDTAQELDAYRGTTAMVIATDHGRGDGREGWKSHSADLPGSENIWVAAFGTGVAATGEDHGGSFTQSQVAPTVARLLGYDFQATDKRIADPLPICQ